MRFWRLPLLSPLHLALTILVGLTVAACETPNPQQSFADITFEHLPDIKLDVEEILVEQAYGPTYNDPYVDHLFPVQPLDAAIRWAGDRLIAAGNGRMARFIVHEASVIETPLDTDQGLTGALTIEPSERYEAKIVVELQILRDGRLEGTTRAEALRTVTVTEGISLHEREGVWYLMTEQIMGDLNSELEQVISSNYASYLVL
ncbi:MAG: hypothetical protein AAF530_14055 [Pseudomonadota bacterium]